MTRIASRPKTSPNNSVQDAAGNVSLHDRCAEPVGVGAVFDLENLSVNGAPLTAQKSFDVVAIDGRSPVVTKVGADWGRGTNGGEPHGPRQAPKAMPQPLGVL